MLGYYRRGRDRLISQFLTWSLIAHFMRLRIAQVGVFIPIIGYALLFSDWAESHLALSDKIVGSSTWFTTKGRLVWLYFGALSFTLALVIYGLRCPSHLKTTLDEREFAKNAGIFDPSGAGEIQHQLGSVTRDVMSEGELIGQEWTSEATPTLIRRHNPKQVANVRKSLLKPATADIYRWYFDWKNGSRPNSLLVCGFLIVAGLALWAGPALETLVLVALRVLLPSLGIL